VNNVRYLIFFFAFLFTNNVSAQFAIIKDHNGYVNIRSEAKIGNNISDKLNNGFVVYCFTPENNWLNIDYSKNNKDQNGYLYKDRIKYIAEFIKIPLYKENETEVIFQKDSLKVIIESQKFDAKTAKLTFLNNNKSFLKQINGRQFFGTDGNIPKRTYKLITVIIGSKTIQLPKISFEDLFEPSLFNTQINYNKNEDVLYITSSNSDGAGGYEVVWIIEKGKYKERKIAYNF
jgi:hypothetical protein